MRLMNFPMDGHACPLKFGSCEFAFSGGFFGAVLMGGGSPIIKRASERLQEEMATHKQTWIHVILPFFFRCLPHQWDRIHLEERPPVLCGGASGILQLAAVRPHWSDGIEREAEIQHRWWEIAFLLMMVFCYDCQVYRWFFALFSFERIVICL